MTHFSRLQARLSLLCASLRRHSPLRPADPIIFPSPFDKRSNHLRCPATTLIKSVATPHPHLSRPNLDRNQAGIKLKIPYPAEPRVPYTRVSPTEFLRRQAPQKLLIRSEAVAEST